jgi:hypothetical protein
MAAAGDHRHWVPCWAKGKYLAYFGKVSVSKLRARSWVVPLQIPVRVAGDNCVPTVRPRHDTQGGYRSALGGRLRENLPGCGIPDPQVTAASEDLEALSLRGYELIKGADVIVGQVQGGVERRPS